MLKIVKPIGMMAAFVVIVFHCYVQAADPIVSVTISPDYQTVKVKPSGTAEQIGVNTAQYAISASCDPSSLETKEVKPVDAAWICVCSETTFVPPVNVQPVPDSPGDPNVSALGGTNPWTTKVSAPYAGQWKLKFTASVTYYVWDKKKEEYVLNDDGSKATFGPYSRTGTCDFIATTGEFKIKLISDDDFPGHAGATFGLGESGTIEVWSIDGTTKYTVVSSSAIPTDVMTASGSTFNALVTVGSATITVKAKNGSTDLGEEKITASVIEPSGGYLIMDPNSKDYNHTQGTFHLTYKCRYVLTPSNVSFAQLKRAEWGENDATGVSYYKGDTDKTKNYFAAYPGVGVPHQHGPFWGIMPCKDTYPKQGGPYINVSESIDTTGTGPGRVFPSSGPTVGKSTLTLPIRYSVTLDSGQSAAKTINASVVSIKEITKPGVDHVITISKTGTSLSKEKDSENKSITPVNPPIF